jgi:TRAP transporter TAXI family solute receptor
MEKRKHLVGLAIIVAIAVIFGMTFPLHAADKLMMGTTATTSSHYVYAVSACKAINTFAGEKINVTAVATGGAVDNMERIHRGQLPFGLGTWAAFYQAYKGIGKYQGKPRPKMRSMWLYSVNTQNYVVRQDSGIKELDDLNGKKYCPGLRGSATEQLVQQILEIIGVKPDYFRGSLSDAVAAVKDNRISGYTKAGAGLDLDGSTKELKAFTKIRILNWPANKAAKVQDALPFVNFVDVPEGKIPGIPAYTTVVQAIGFICYDDSLTNDQVYTIVKAIHDGKKYQEAAYPAMKGFNIPEMTMKLTKIPLHPGAIRYYKEIGVEVPAHLIPPEMK